ncbi:nitrogen regulation protein NR(II) [Paraferrimonas sp. SM1919]|uniref:nitrogen regulation protein NR(II) n=1 Tax=Paraferrimonas sp. SM1919 TaxID=2662263 RepID=UPI0013D3EE5E|nr:nitrogen regulation protein NR(II) [Paraferrimonas sp. SM1919]
MQPLSILDNIVTAVMVINSDLKPDYVNSAAEQLFRLGKHRLIEHNLESSCQELGFAVTHLKQAIIEQHSITINAAPLITLEGEHTLVDITIIPYATEPATAIVEFKQVGQQLKIHQQLQSDSQQQAARLLVRSLAHEIKNPLGGLRGAAQLLERELGDDDLKEFTQMIIEQADRLRNLVDTLLGPQKPTAHNLVNIHQVLDKVEQLVRLTLNQQQRISVDYDPSIPALMMDSDQIQQALLNVVQNAVEASNDEAIHIRLQTRAHSQVTIGNIRHKTVVAIKISNDGPPIPAEMLDTLFYPMVTNKAQGSGMGLSITHNIIRLHQGKIECQSFPGETSFTILLPLVSHK